MSEIPRIFVVDDEPDVVDLLRTILEAEGFEVETATDGRTAVARLVAHPPELLILDLMMPEFDGFEVLRLFRQQPSGRGVPVLILSARTGHIDQVESLQQGATAYAFKPFSPKELVRQVRGLLGGEPREPAGG